MIRHLLRYLSLILLAVACAPSKSLAGSWSDGHGISYVFDDAGHVTRLAMTAGTAATYGGNYKLAGNNLTITMIDAKSPDPQTRQAAMLVIKDNPTTTFQLTWSGPNVIQLVGKLGSSTFKRQ